MSFEFPVPEPHQLLRDALEGLHVGERLCSCPDRYHGLWSVLKAVGVHRGLYTEADALGPILGGRLAAGGHVLLAGTADAGAITLMNACAGAAPVRYTAVDRCQAPLDRVSRFAASRGLALETWQGDLADLAGQGPWDLAFLHYTLSFPDADLRRRVIESLANRLTEGGAIVCAVKFSRTAADGGSSDTDASWMEDLRPRIVQLLSDHPEALADVDRWLPAYALNRAARNAHQPSPEAIEADFIAAGLVIRSRVTTSRKAWSISPENPVRDRQQSVLLVAERCGGI